jgi:hypothetical protein
LNARRRDPTRPLRAATLSRGLSRSCSGKKTSRCSRTVSTGGRNAQSLSSDARRIDECIEPGQGSAAGLAYSPLEPRLPQVDPCGCSRDRVRGKRRRGARGRSRRADGTPSRYRQTRAPRAARRIDECIEPGQGSAAGLAYSPLEPRLPQVDPCARSNTGLSRSCSGKKTSRCSRTVSTGGRNAQSLSDECIEPGQGSAAGLAYSPLEPRLPQVDPCGCSRT